jgi:hypothetical protein
MDEDRNLGVTEARFALTLLICLLVAVGYVVLLRIGGSTASTIEVSPNIVSQPQPVPEDQTSPKVLKIEGADVATRPGGLRRGDESSTSPTGSAKSQRR